MDYSNHLREFSKKRKRDLKQSKSFSRKSLRGGEAGDSSKKQASCVSIKLPHESKSSGRSKGSRDDVLSLVVKKNARTSLLLLSGFNRPGVLISLSRESKILRRRKFLWSMLTRNCSSGGNIGSSVTPRKLQDEKDKNTLLQAQVNGLTKKVKGLKNENSGMPADRKDEFTNKEVKFNALKETHQKMLASGCHLKKLYESSKFENERLYSSMDPLPERLRRCILYLDEVKEPLTMKNQCLGALNNLDVIKESGHDIPQDFLDLMEDDMKLYVTEIEAITPFYLESDNLTPLSTSQHVQANLTVVLNNHVARVNLPEKEHGSNLGIVTSKLLVDEFNTVGVL